MPEHDEYPPQWPPPPWHAEPTTRPQSSSPAAEFEVAAQPESEDEEWSRRFEAMPPMPSQSGAPDDNSDVGIDPRLSDRTPVVIEHAPQPAPTAPVPAAEPARKAPAPPPTHARAVRMTIYGIGGAIVVGLLAAIIVMAGGRLGPNSDDDTGSANPLLSNGKIDKKQYAKLAASAGSAEWMKWRYGAAGKGSGGTTVKEPKTKKLPGSGGIKHVYQEGDGSSAAHPGNVQGQLGFVPDDASKSGVGHVTTMETTDSTLGFTPRPGGRFTADTEEPDLTGKGAKCMSGASDHLVAADRAHGKGFAAQSVLAFSSGAVVTTGISGAQKGTCVSLPDGNVPTSVTLTPSNEFALVTVWDTALVRGRVAVIAMGDSPGNYASSWAKVYPGLPGPGDFSFSKLLGFVDLKDIKAPTAIAAGTDYAGSNDTRAAANLADAGTRSKFSGDVAKQGYAVVASLAEKRLEWIDLSPLLSGFQKAYFSGDSSAFASPGTGAKDWPPTFATKPAFVPTVGADTTLDEQPMSVADVNRTAYVADAAGTVASYDAADVDKVSRVSTTRLKGAVTCLQSTSDGKQVLATSRSDSSVSWISASAKAMKVTQTLRDSRLVDPICATDSPASASGTAAHVVSVADYSGALRTYRYGKGVLANGTNVDLKAGQYEYGGDYSPAGKPFVVTVTADKL
jgi:hypothetical protein